MEENKNFEEMELDRYIDALNKEDISVPDALEERLISKVELLKTRRHYFRNITAACVGFCILFAGGVKWNPAFAAYASNIPGLRTAVEWLQGDSGIKNAKEHGYAEMSPVLTEENSYVLSLNNIFFDEDRLRLSAVISGEKIARMVAEVNEERSRLAYGEDSPVRDRVDELRMEVKFIDFEQAGGIQRTDYGENNKVVASDVEKLFSDDEANKFINTKPENVNLDIKLFKGKQLLHHFSPIQVPMDYSVFMTSKVYTQNKTLEYEHTKAMIGKLTVSPTRMKMSLKFDMEEGYLFESFVDPYLKDDRGNVYKAEGLVSVHNKEDERTLYFVPSIYFEKKPSRLYLCHSGIRIASQDGKRFTLKLDDDYPRTIYYMGQPVVIEKVKWYHTGKLDIIATVPADEKLRIQNFGIINYDGPMGWGASERLIKDNKIKEIRSSFDIEKRESYEMEFQYAGYLLDDSDTVCELNIN